MPILKRTQRYFRDAEKEAYELERQRLSRINAKQREEHARIVHHLQSVLRKLGVDVEEEMAKAAMHSSERDTEEHPVPDHEAHV